MTRTKIACFFLGASFSLILPLFMIDFSLGFFTWQAWSVRILEWVSFMVSVYARHPDFCPACGKELKNFWSYDNPKVGCQTPDCPGE
jgi:hypothetical protein